ncbi:MAG: DUF302 domain-containing protein [Shimia thalassica]|uniref:DUF302 domain-containing protein n=2 Tax=Shimia thalassica TaxID=1715693 RepID=UPI003297105F
MLRMKSIVAAGVIATLPVLAFAEGLQDKVDALTQTTSSEVAASGLVPIVMIDHARLAAEAGVEMPPSIVQVFSSGETNSRVLFENIRAGLDLPYRVLTYVEGTEARQIYTNSAFLAQRHGLMDEATLAQYDADMSAVTKGLAAAPTEGLTKNYGIIELQSPYEVADSAANLKAIVTKQADTVWFGEVDFQAEAAAAGVDLPPAVLLLFGGPAPGGVAMRDFPAIGLDAFCQKLLVYQDNTGQTRVIFNDIAAMARLHYGRSAEPHDLLNQRLTETFKTALK